MESRIVSVGRRELEKIESRFEIVGHDAKRGSFHIILELGVVPAAMKSRIRLAKPRLLARVMIDELERARQQENKYTPTAEVGQLIQNAAVKLSKEAAQ